MGAAATLAAMDSDMAKAKTVAHLALTGVVGSTASVSTNGTRAGWRATIRAWTLAWGDGTVTTGTGVPTPTDRAHSYSAIGTYSMMLTVTDSKGVSAHDSHSVSIGTAAQHTLSVVSGSGDGTYPAGQTVSITADPPATGYAFFQWTGGVVASQTTSTTTVVMPASNLTLTATYVLIQPPPTPPNYSLQVNNGSGSGTYASGAVVAIAAFTAPPGQTFSAWTGATVASSTSASTTLTMPAANATVNATYVDLPPTPGLFNLTVSSGTGSGAYAAGATVPITANAAPTGQVFAQWTGNGVQSPPFASTNVIMPGANTTVTATYGVIKGANLLVPSDFSLIGAFRMPLSFGVEINGLDFPNGLTGRYVNGQLRLYTCGYTGITQEYIPPPDANLSISGPYTAATAGTAFTDIFQNAMVRLVSNGFSDPPVVGIAQPSGLYWDPIDSRMYWTRVVSYNNTFDTSDTCIGYSTINDGAGTGTGIDMWKLSPPNNYPTSYGNRWCFYPFPIPPSFMNAYCPGQRLGIGFGGAVSIISNGPFSEGPSVFAIAPPQHGVDPHWDYVLTPPKQLLFHPASALNPRRRAPRPMSLYTQSDFDDSNGMVWNWADGVDGGVSGVWIDGTNKQGVIMFCAISGGNTRTTIAASPAPTHAVFTVVPPHDIRPSDIIKWDTNITTGQPNYAFCYGRVLSVSGNQITLDAATIANGDITPDVSAAIPTVGGAVVAGSWYQGGGTATSRWYNALYMYDPADLAACALGGTAQPVPYYMADYPLAGQSSYPFPGSSVGGQAGGTTGGAWFDATTKRLYVLHRGLPNGGRLIYVYSVNC